MPSLSKTQQFSVSQFVKFAKGRSSRKVQQELPDIRRKCWGCHLWVEDSVAQQAVCY